MADRHLRHKSTADADFSAVEKGKLGRYAAVHQANVSEGTVKRLGEAQSSTKSIKRTLATLACWAYEIASGGGTLVIEHALGVESYFGHDATNTTGDKDRAITPEIVEATAAIMRSWVSGTSTTVEVDMVRHADVVAHFAGKDPPQQDKLAVLRVWRPHYMDVLILKDTERNIERWHYCLEPYETEMKKLRDFELRVHEHGLLLRYSKDKGEWHDNPKLFQAVMEYERWGNVLGIDNIPDVAQSLYFGKRGKVNREPIWSAESLHSSRLTRIASKLDEDFDRKRVICIAGPSSSGKTTTAKRLAIELRVCGRGCLPIGMDDYYVDNAVCPRTKDGEMDFEQLHALNLELLTSRIHALLRGEEVPQRKFQFGLGGHGYDAEDKPKIKLEARDFIVIEGLHALNPEFTAMIGKDKCQLIYINCLSQLNVDNTHPLSMSDVRLVRRMVRDWRFRGYTATETLKRWPLVRAGEHKYIFPFTEEADFVFNTALVYELSVLANWARPLLSTIDDRVVLPEADRLLNLLGLFQAISEHLVPGTSILREYIGNGEFDY